MHGFEIFKKKKGDHCVHGDSENSVCVAASLYYLGEPASTRTCPAVLQTQENNFFQVIKNDLFFLSSLKSQSYSLL